MEFFSIYNFLTMICTELFFSYFYIHLFLLLLLLLIVATVIFDNSLFSFFDDSFFFYFDNWLDKISFFKKFLLKSSLLTKTEDFSRKFWKIKDKLFKCVICFLDHKKRFFEESGQF